MPKCSHFDPRAKFWSSLNTCISHVKHSIAFIFSMIASYLLDINFTNLERKHCLKKRCFTSKYASTAKLQKHAILWWKTGLIRHCFQEKFFGQNSILFRNCKEMRFSHLSPLCSNFFYINLQINKKKLSSTYNFDKSLTCCSRSLGSIDYKNF